MSPDRTSFRALAILAFASIAPQAAQAEHRLVPSQYSTIQAAINACAPGDFVDVSPGVYSGPGNINLDFHGVDLSCRGVGGPEVTIIDAAPPGSTRRGFSLTSGETHAAEIDGFTIRNGHAVAGGGIYCDGASPTIRNCRILGCSSYFGGGIYLEASSALVQAVTIESCLVIGLPTQGQGGGGACLKHSAARFEDCIIRGNRIENFVLPGGGVYAVDGGTFARCVITGNSPSGAWATLALFDHSTLADNAGSDLLITEIADLVNCLISDPCEDDDLVVAGWATARCCIIEGNVGGTGTLQWLTAPITGDPGVCLRAGCTRPTPAGNFALLPNSPGRPENNDCGEWIGAITASDCSTVGVEGAPPSADLDLRLLGANPTRGRVELAFHLPVAATASISVLDVSGRRLARLGELEAGPGEVTWQGSLRGDAVRLAPGVYVVEVRAAGLEMSRRVVLLP